MKEERNQIETRCFKRGVETTQVFKPRLLRNLIKYLLGWSDLDGTLAYFIHSADSISSFAGKLKTNATKLSTVLFARKARNVICLMVREIRPSVKNGFLLSPFHLSSFFFSRFSFVHIFEFRTIRFTLKHEASRRAFKLHLKLVNYRVPGIDFRSKFDRTVR